MRSKITTKVNKYVVGHLCCNLKYELPKQFTIKIVGDVFL